MQWQLWPFYVIEISLKFLLHKKIPPNNSLLLGEDLPLLPPQKVVRKKRVHRVPGHLQAILERVTGSHLLTKSAVDLVNVHPHNRCVDDLLLVQMPSSQCVKRSHSHAIVLIGLRRVQQVAAIGDKLDVLDNQSGLLLDLSLCSGQDVFSLVGNASREFPIPLASGRTELTNQCDFAILVQDDNRDRRLATNNRMINRIAIITLIDHLQHGVHIRFDQDKPFSLLPLPILLKYLHLLFL